MCEMTSFSMTSLHVDLNEAAKCVDIPCVPLAIKTIMIVLFKILTLFHFKAIRSSWLTLNEILIVSMAKGTHNYHTIHIASLLIASLRTLQ